MIYYHGTSEKFQYFDLNRAENYKDFGKGVYLSEKHWHAEAIAKKRNGIHGYIMKFNINTDDMRKKLRVKEFRKVSIPWVKFVLLNRNSIIAPEYDIVIGATADASAQEILEYFYRKHKNREASIKEYNELISRLAAYKYPKQICLLSQKAVNYFNEKYVDTEIVY